jgi:type VI secretion system secreted protein Hcp
MAVDNFMWFSAAATGGMLASNATKPAGETMDKHFKTKNALEILSISFGASQAETTSSQATGSSAGKVKFDEFSIEKFVDLASVPIFNACVAGAHFPTVHVAIRKAGGDQLNYFQIIFRQLFVTSISISGGGGEEAAKETIKFKFNAMGVQYVRQLATGAAGTPIQAMWSIATGKPELTIPGLAAADGHENP